MFAIRTNPGETMGPEGVDGPTAPLLAPIAAGNGASPPTETDYHFGCWRISLRNGQGNQTVIRLWSVLSREYRKKRPQNEGFSMFSL